MPRQLYLGQLPEGRLDLEADHLTTHGVIIGMTGSGKTGLAVTLLEELVLQGVPVLALDPKGDLANLGLVFPDLAPDDFAPWLADGDPGEVAARWKQGLAGSGLGAPELATLKNKLDLRLYAPGGDVARGVDLLGSLRRPTADVAGDAGALRDLVIGTVQALLGLVGVNADPLRDPEPVLLARLVEDTWTSGRELSLETLILQLVDPPYAKLGVFPVDTFFPRTKRLDLAMKLNGVLASPAFAAWRRGEPLDLDAMLAQGDRTPVNVFCMSQLAESERQFFAALLLERLVAWSRRQPGTSRLRALLYLDEAFGYLPPHPANPPTKRAIVTLLKQARAVGVGVVLATQNPVDLDYKALSNAGCWFLGKLSTRQDVARVADGLRAAGTGVDASTSLAGLAPRQFLLRNARSPGMPTFSTRWAMTWLRGPVTPRELARLAAQVDPVPVVHAPPQAPPAPAAVPPPPPSATVPPPSPPASLVPPPPPQPEGLLAVPPPALRGHARRFLSPAATFAARLEGAFDALREDAQAGGAVHRPVLHAEVGLRFDEERLGFVIDEHHHLVLFPLDHGIPKEATILDLQAGDVLDSPPEHGWYQPLPAACDEARELTAARDALLDRIYRRESRGMWTCPPLKLHGRAGETLEAFTARCRDEVEERIEADLAKVSARYEKKADALDKKAEKKRDTITLLETTLKGRQAEEVMNAGQVVASFFFGRSRSVNSLVSKRRQTAETELRLEAAEADIERYEDDKAELVLELEAEESALREKHEEALSEIEERPVGLERADVRCISFGVLWVPVSSAV